MHPARQAIVGASRVVVRDSEWGKGNARVVADLMLDGRSLAAVLVAAGHGCPYGR